MGRPKKVKRAYHRKAVQENPEGTTANESGKPEAVIELKQGVEENVSELAAELDKATEKKQHQMFHNLEEGRIELETAEMVKREAIKKAEIEKAEKARQEGAKPKLICPFCNHVQYNLNSKDRTSAWCEVCGRCFQAIWK